MSRAILLAAIAVASCAPLQSKNARTWMPGRQVEDVEQCMGIPSHTLKLATGETISQWDYSDKGATTAIPLTELAALPITLPLALAGTVSLDDSGTCHAMVTSRDGLIEHVMYSGDSDSLVGRDAKCAPIVRGCLRHWTGEQ